MFEFLIIIVGNLAGMSIGKNNVSTHFLLTYGNLGNYEILMAKVWKYALLNAVRYKKSPKADAVLKKLLAEDFELRKGAKVPPLVMQEEIKSIELLSKEERLEELISIARS